MATGGRTTAELLRDAAAALAAAGCAGPRLDAELLLGHVLGVERTTVLAHPEARVGPGAAGAFAALVERRAAGEPVAYLRGFREFHGLAIATDARALVPRPETEVLVDEALAWLGARLTETARPHGTPPLRVADVGTGSGAIAIALVAALRRRRMDGEVLVVATDASPDALALARENAVGHGVADRIVFLEADLLPPVVEPRPVLVCANLPYVASGDLAGLAPEVRHEPRAALDGGPDGLDVVRRLLDRLPGVLAPGGLALLEIGADQGPAALAEAAARLPGWPAEVRPDLAGRPRLLRLEVPA